MVSADGRRAKCSSLRKGAGEPAGPDRHLVCLLVVDPDPSEPLEQIDLAHRFGGHPLDHSANRSPRHSHQLGDPGLRRVHRQPGDLILKRAREPRLVRSCCVTSNGLSTACQVTHSIACWMTNRNWNIVATLSYCSEQWTGGRARPRPSCRSPRAGRTPPQSDSGHCVGRLPRPQARDLRIRGLWHGAPPALLWCVAQACR